MDVIQVYATPGVHHVVVLTAYGTRENRALQSSACKGLAASRTGIVVRIQGFFELAEKNVASGDLFCSQNTGSNCVEAKHVFPSHLIARSVRRLIFAIAVEASYGH